MWGLRAKYCALCGAELISAQVEGRERKRCPSCSFVLYLNPASAAAAVVLDGQGRVLLMRRSIPPHQGSWALPAGYQEVDEGPRETVVREVREETGIEIAVQELLDVIFIPDDPRKPANVTVFLCREVGGQLAAGDDALDAAWFPLDALPEDLGFACNVEILEGVRKRHSSG